MLEPISRNGWPSLTGQRHGPARLLQRNALRYATAADRAGNIVSGEDVDSDCDDATGTRAATARRLCVARPKRPQSRPSKWSPASASADWPRPAPGRRQITDLLKQLGGEGEIRTPDTLARMPHFECGAFDHSATSPQDAGRHLRSKRAGRTERGLPETPDRVDTVAGAVSPYQTGCGWHKRQCRPLAAKSGASANLRMMHALKPAVGKAFRAGQTGVCHLISVRRALTST